jgi:hypothetical protein
MRDSGIEERDVELVHSATPLLDLRAPSRGDTTSVRTRTSPLAARSRSA